MKTCLVLIAHGSKNPNWLVPFQRLARDLKQEAGEHTVHLCYMEHSRPTLRELASQIVGSGATRIRLLPLFLATGSHLSQDIPAQVEEVRNEYPGLEVEILPPLVEHPQFFDLMRALGKHYVPTTTA